MGETDVQNIRGEGDARASKKGVERLGVCDRDAGVRRVDSSPATENRVTALLGDLDPSSVGNGEQGSTAAG